MVLNLKAALALRSEWQPSLVLKGHNARTVVSGASSEVRVRWCYGEGETKMEPLKSLAGSPRVRPARLSGTARCGAGSGPLAEHALHPLQRPNG